MLQMQVVELDRITVGGATEAASLVIEVAHITAYLQVSMFMSKRVRCRDCLQMLSL